MIRVIHAFIWFSIKKGGGTCDLVYKIVKSQEKHPSLKPSIISSSDHLDNLLVKDLSKTKFIITKKIFNLFNLNLNNPAFNKIFYFKPDIIHMHLFRSLQNFFLYLYCFFTNTPYVIDAHGSVPYWDKDSFKKKLFDFVIGKRIMLNASAWIAESDVGIKEYTDYFPQLLKKKIDLISPPFGIDEFTNLPKTSRSEINQIYAIPKDNKIISFLGRLHKDKGIDFLLRGISSLLKKRTDITCLLVGSDDGHEISLKKLAKELNIENNVHFVGFKSGPKKNEILKNSDIVVQLSRFEQGAWAPIEGVLCGTPIIVTRDTGAGEDVARLDAGYLVEYENIDEFVSNVEYIFDNEIEANNKTNLARDYIINNLSMDARMNEYISIYNRCMEEKKI